MTTIRNFTPARIIRRAGLAIIMIAGSLIGFASPVAAVADNTGDPPSISAVTNEGSQTIKVTWSLSAAFEVNNFIVTAYLGDTEVGYISAPKTASFLVVSELTSAADAEETYTLVNGSTYEFTVKSVYNLDIQESDRSDPIIPYGPPDAPTLVAARAATADDMDSLAPEDDDSSGTVYVSWSEPEDNGDEILSYTVTLDGPTDVVETFDDAPLPLEVLIDGLDDGSPYVVSVVATNSAGDSDSSNDITATPCGEIGAPTDLLAVAGDTEVSLSWLAPESSGCGDIVGYEIYQGDDALDISTLIGRTSVVDDWPEDGSVADEEPTTFVADELDNGTEYFFAVKAVGDGSNGIAGDDDDETSGLSDEVSETPTADDGGDGDGGDGDGGDGDGGDGDSSGGGGGGGGSFPSDRVGGADRYGTAVLLSQANFSPGVPVVYLASGLGFADALSAGPAADRGSGPILLVQQNAIPASTKTELTRLNPGRIVILGGTAAISAAVAADADNYTTGSVTRVGGADRYETSAALSAATFSPGVPVAYLATGTSFADALAAGPVAAGNAPVLLVQQNAIPASTKTELTRLNPGRIVILGGTAAISAAVAADADNYTTGSVTRVGGADRYETASLLSSGFFPSSVPLVYLATGANFADALAAAPLGTPILLVKDDCIPRSSFRELARLSAGDIVVLGGQNAVSDRVRRLAACTD